MSVEIRIGTSGFYYEHWKGVFYPEDLPKSRFFEYYCRYFDTVELNSTFYHLPKAKTIEHWRSKSPDGFLFALKAYRAITHYKRLVDVEDELYRFLHLVKPLRPKLGPILFQLPPSLHKDLNVLESFLHLLPPSYRFAVEFRHRSWYEEEIFDLLRKFGVALCIHDFGKKQTPLEVTSDFVYIRFHGPSGRYRGSYDDEVLREWAKKIVAFERDVFCYFNNDYEGNAVKNAFTLKAFVAQVKKQESLDAFGS